MAANFPDGVEIKVEIGFASDPADDPQTWTDVSADVVEIRDVFRGKQSEYDQLAPASFTIILRDTDRTYDPTNTSSSLYPNVVPMKRIRIQVIFATVTYTLASGYVSGWFQQWGHYEGRVEVRCVDGTRNLNGAKLAGSAYEAAVLADSPTLYYPLQSDGVGLGAVTPALIQSSFDAGSVSFTDAAVPVGAGVGATGDGSDSSSLLVALVSSASSSAPLSVEWWADIESGATGSISVHDAATSGFVLYLSDTDVRVEFSNAANNDSLTTFGGVSIGAGAVSHGSHHFAVTADASNVYLYVDGTLRSTTAHTSTATTVGADTYRLAIGVDAELTVSHVATYASTLSAATVAAHHLAGKHAYGHPVNEKGGARIARVLDEIGWPSGLRDLDAGGTRHGPYLPAGQSAIDYIRSVETLERGLFFFDVDGNATFKDRHQLALAASQVTFSDDGDAAAVEYDRADPDGVSVDTIRNIATVSWVRANGVGGAITVRDAASITAYGESAESIDAPTNDDPKVSAECARYVLRLAADPATRFPSVLVDMRQRPSVHLPAILGLDLGDIVTVERTPYNIGSQISVRCVVLGIRHEIVGDASEMRWAVELYLSPAPPAADDVPYFQLADATYGRLGAAYGNTLTY